MLKHMISKMITSRLISREVNESIPLPNATLEIVLEDDVAVPPTLLIMKQLQCTQRI